MNVQNYCMLLYHMDPFSLLFLSKQVNAKRRKSEVPDVSVEKESNPISFCHSLSYTSQNKFIYYNFRRFKYIII